MTRCACRHRSDGYPLRAVELMPQDREKLPNLPLAQKHDETPQRKIEDRDDDNDRHKRGETFFYVEHIRPGGCP